MPPAAVVRSRRCCVDFDVLVFADGDVLGLSSQPENAPTCPVCGDAGVEIFATPALLGLGDVGGAGRMYPRRDLSLGRDPRDPSKGLLIQNRQHEDRVLKSLGMVHMPADEVERRHRQFRLKAEQAVDRHREAEARSLADPTNRKFVESGQLQDEVVKRSETPELKPKMVVTP